MAKENIEILQQFGDSLVEGTQEILPNVSGKTRQSLRREVDANGIVLTVFGASYIGTLEFGRGKTQKSGKGDLVKNIKEWIKLRGLDLNPFAVAANIHKYGNTLNRIVNGVGVVNYQANPIGLKGVLSQQRINSFKEAFAKRYLNQVKSEVLTELR